MVIIQRTSTRPSLDISWAQTTDDFLSYRTQTYVNTGKLVCEKLLVDDFTLIYKLTFAVDADYDAYDSDPKVLEHRTAEEAYISTNGITSNRTVTRS